jgi:DNA-binding CsgD family transcriptional regulator
VSRGVGMEQARGLEDLIGGIYDAAVDPDLWTEAIARVVDAVGCRTGVFYEHDTATHQSQPLGFHRFNTDFIGDYVAHYGALDPWNARVMQWPVGLAAPTYALMPEDEFRRTEFYQDYLRRTGVFYGLGGLVERADGRVAVFGVQRNYEDGRFPEESVALVGALMPHLKRAYRMNRAMLRVRGDRAILEETLHLMAQPVLIVDREGRLVFANSSAARLLATGDGIKLADERIAAAHRDDKAALTALLHPLSDEAPKVIALRRPGRKRSLVVQAVPLRSDGRWETTGRVALLIEAEPPQIPSLDHLASAFSLTSAEAKLWSGLAAGATLAEIAQRQQTSVNTLRVHLGRLFAKLGVHRQADLVRLALEHRPPESKLERNRAQP